ANGCQTRSHEKGQNQPREPDFPQDDAGTETGALKGLRACEETKHPAKGNALGAILKTDQQSQERYHDEHGDRLHPPAKRQGREQPVCVDSCVGKIFHYTPLSFEENSSGCSKRANTSI